MYIIASGGWPRRAMILHTVVEAMEIARMPRNSQSHERDGAGERSDMHLLDHLFSCSFVLFNPDHAFIQIRCFQEA